MKCILIISSKIFMDNGFKARVRKLKTICQAYWTMLFRAYCQIILGYLKVGLIVEENNRGKYQGVKEFHMLAHISCYCKIMVFSPLKLGDTYCQSSKDNK